MSNKKVLRVNYSVDEAFAIPSNINLEDKTQVEYWWVKYLTLHILLTSGKEIEVKPQGWIDNNDFKWPSEDYDVDSIVDASDCGMEDDDEAFKPVELDDDEEQYGVCISCHQDGKFIGKKDDEWICQNCSC